MYPLQTLKLLNLDFDLSNVFEVVNIRIPNLSSTGLRFIEHCIAPEHTSLSVSEILKRSNKYFHFILIKYSGLCFSFGRTENLGIS